MRLWLQSYVLSYLLLLDLVWGNNGNCLWISVCFTNFLMLIFFLNKTLVAYLNLFWQEWDKGRSYSESKCCNISGTADQIVKQRTNKPFVHEQLSLFVFLIKEISLWINERTKNISEVSMNERTMFVANIVSISFFKL